ncbi:MAG: FemAB family PEP-CTERM system-associated protein [Alphaproteobacteria bacterium]|nr:FemAB family PEP-CTERM system-associated protein [Alphaproteobacteria bacterium]MDE2041992.1 FemAB family PEP-CTERM system-associated protein [Alphaproteobacteria bacterium]MDE2340227.1 FemAB family PEP-CTERM system-associated protein [Alphaproteobacteria bacterium]
MMHAVIPALRLRPANLKCADERARISAFIAEDMCTTPFHRLDWIDAIEAGTGHDAYVLVAESGRALRGVLPLNAVHSPLFGRALVSTGFAVNGGILAHDEVAAVALARAAEALAHSLSCPTIELRGGPAPAGWHVDAQTYLGFVRDLARDDDAQLTAIPRKQRAEVRKSLDLGMTVTVENGAAARAAHYAVYAESVRNLGTPVFPRSLFSALMDAFGEDADILTVHHEGQPVASVLSLYHRGTVMPYWGGGTRTARHLRANELMYFALMNHARARGCTRFDFGRSKAGTGAAAYKKNWGFEAVPLTYAKWSAKGQAPRNINPLDPRYRLQVQLWQKLPLWAANRIGPFIARGLG